jgi:hypothetical protein
MVLPRLLGVQLFFWFCFFLVLSVLSSTKTISNKREIMKRRWLVLFVWWGCFVSTDRRGVEAVAVAPGWLVHTAIGFSAGSAGAIAAYPFDYVKSVLQTEEGRSKYPEGGWQGGPLALYRGLVVNLVGLAPEKTIKLGTNDFLRPILQPTLGIWGEVLAGACAGLAQVTITNPLEAVKVRLQTSSMTVSETIQNLRSQKRVYWPPCMRVSMPVESAMPAFRPFYSPYIPTPRLSWKELQIIMTRKMPCSSLELISWRVALLQLRLRFWSHPPM